MVSRALYNVACAYLVRFEGAYRDTPPAGIWRFQLNAGHRESCKRSTNLSAAGSVM
jgi:hypothetical protein